MTSLTDRNASTGAVGVGGDVQRNVTVTNITRDDGPPTLLRSTPPAPPAHFTGREAYLEKFTQLLTQGESVAITVLHGMGGIGKTSLAQKLAEELQGRDDPGGRSYFPGGVLWWSLGPKPNVFTALDVWARHADPRSDLSSLPDASARANVVRSMLAQLGKVCVIIDDVCDDASLSVLKEAIPPGCPILITTRDADLAKSFGGKVERIDALNDSEAIALLIKLLGPLKGHEAAAKDIAHLTEGLPLALELICGFADSPADLPLLVQQLRTKPTLDVLKRSTTRAPSIEACFALSYNLLDAEMQRRFRALGVFAPTPFDRDAIVAIWNDRNLGNSIARIFRRLDAKRENDLEHPIDEALELLVRRNLLTKEEGGKYRQHAVLHAYALALLEKENEYRTTAARHADYYRRFAREKDWRTVEHFFHQIDHAWQWTQANVPEQIIDYVSAVQDFLTLRGRQFERLKWLNVGLQQARLSKNRKSESGILNSIAFAYHDLGRPADALDTFQQALAVVHEVGNRSLEGTTLNNIGLVYDALGRMQDALDAYQQALAIRREVGDRAGEGVTLNNIGAAYRALGKEQAALDTFQRALAIVRKAGNRSMEGTTLNNIGAVYRALGKQQGALNTFQQALAVMREAGDRQGEGITLVNIGGLLEQMNRFEEAESVLQEAVTALRDASCPQAITAQQSLDRVRSKLGKGNAEQ